MANPTSEELLRELVLFDLLWMTVALHLVDRPLFVIGLACTDSTCFAIAEWQCFWPGQTAAKCTRCRDGWARIAEAFGFELQSKPLEVRHPDPSAARFAAMELW
ncbi:MAG TPA: hypothetical protein VIV58_31850 [Kofleriaceae bacterium]